MTSSARQATTAARAERGSWRALDGLRALACLSVFVANFHHSLGMSVAGRAGPFDASYFAESGVGVALLMVLSGLLIGRSFWQRIDRGEPFDNPWRYVLRRAVRIVPAYWACLAAFAIASDAASDPVDLVAHVLFVNNLREPSFYSISPQFWTIGIFVQFYVIAPLIFLAIRRAGVRGVGVAITLLMAAAGAYAVHAALMATRDTWFGWPLTLLTTRDGYVLSHSPLAHLPLFLIGAAAAVVLVDDTGSRRAAGRIAAVVCWTSVAAVAWLACVPAADRLQWPYARYLFPWMPVALAATLASAPLSPSADRVFGVWPLRALGRISYGVYIYQFACMVAVARLMQVGPSSAPAVRGTLALVSLGLTILVASASYFVMERPLRRWVDRR
ncbi:MAG: acyltransferase [Acidobacteria bacterium]|nr:acyltransferase [Acidobacteriota bacterium]